MHFRFNISFKIQDLTLRQITKKIPREIVNPLHSFDKNMYQEFRKGILDIPYKRL